MSKLTFEQQSDISFRISSYLQGMPNVFQYGGGLSLCLDFEISYFSKNPELYNEVRQYVTKEYELITGFNN